MFLEQNVFGGRGFGSGFGRVSVTWGHSGASDWLEGTS
jgi:hypothetical protein